MKADSRSEPVVVQNIVYLFAGRALRGFFEGSLLPSRERETRGLTLQWKHPRFQK